MRFVLALIVFVTASSCTRRDQPLTADAPSSQRAVLFVTADLRGYLNPCGCSENMRGGIARAAHQLARTREGDAPVLFIDGGNSLFGASTISPVRAPQDDARASALARALNQMKLDVRVVGALDDARGVAFREALSLPELADGEGRLLSAGQLAIGVVAGSDAESLERGAKRVRQDGAKLVVALVDLPLAGVEALLKSRELGLDLAIATRSEGEFGAEENRVLRGATPIAQLQSKGRSLLRIDVSLTGSGTMKLVAGAQEQERTLAALEERIRLLDAEVNRPGISPELARMKQAKLAELVVRRQALASTPPSAPDHDAFSLRFVPLDASLPSDPPVAKIVEDYDRAVGALNLGWARAHGQDCPPAGKDAAAFVGNEACRACHEEAFGVYEASKHAHAWETLVEVGKQFHLDCVTCHVTGADRPGGVCRIDRVAGREDVGCESCHGPGSLHVEAPSDANVIAAPKAAQCLGCHNPENSPHFQFDAYLPRILGKGHGG